MEVKKDFVIPLGLAMAIIGGAITGGIMIGDLQSKVESSSRQTSKQWEKLGELTITNALLQGKLDVLSSKFMGFKEFKEDTKRQLEQILKEIRNK